MDSAIVERKASNTACLLYIHLLLLIDETPAYHFQVLSNITCLNARQFKCTSLLSMVFSSILKFNAINTVE